jgi:uncharacterized protein YkvS
MKTYQKMHVTYTTEPVPEVGDWVRTSTGLLGRVTTVYHNQQMVDIAYEYSCSWSSLTILDTVTYTEKS